jgi:hypothetical protein
MLALTDSALARLAIAATAIAPEKRAAWLEEIALRLDPIHECSHRKTSERLRTTAKGLGRGERRHHPVLRKMSETCTGVHAPPRAVAIPRAASDRATPRSEVSVYGPDRLF